MHAHGDTILTCSTVCNCCMWKFHLLFISPNSVWSLCPRVVYLKGLIFPLSQLNFLTINRCSPDLEGQRDMGVITSGLS